MKHVGYVEAGQDAACCPRALCRPSASGSITDQGLHDILKPICALKSIPSLARGPQSLETGYGTEYQGRPVLGAKELF